MRFGTIAFLTVGVLLALTAGLVPRRWRLPAWTLVIVAGVGPWGSWVGHEHWARVEWIPFTQIVRVRDLLLNLVLYIPIGYFIGAGPGPGRRPGLRRLLAAVAYAVVLSVATELSQVYSHGRFPAVTDVTMNTVGAVVGVLVALGRTTRPRRGAAKGGGRQARLEAGRLEG